MCWMLLCVVAQSLKPIKLFSQQLPTFFLFRDRRSVALQCWIRLHNSSNIVGATHAHYAWFTKTYGLYPSHNALQVPTLLGVVASVCTPLPTRSQQLPTLLTQQFARRLTTKNLVFFQIAVERKCTRLDWHVLYWNKLALDFYDRIGAVCMDEWRLYRLSGKRLLEFADKKLE